MSAGKITICARGFNQARLLQSLSSKNIKVQLIDRKNAGEITFTIASSAREKTFAILDQMCYTYIILKRSDFKSVLAMAAAR